MVARKPNTGDDLPSLGYFGAIPEHPPEMNDAAVRFIRKRFNTDQEEQDSRVTEELCSMLELRY